MEELHELYCSLNIFRLITSRRMRWAAYIARMDEYIDVYRVSVGIPEERRPLRKNSHRRDDNIMMDLQEVGCEGMEWIKVAQDGES